MQPPSLLSACLLALLHLRSLPRCSPLARSLCFTFAASLRGLWPAGHLLLACVLAVPLLGRPSLQTPPGFTSSLPASPHACLAFPVRPLLPTLCEPSALRPRCVGFLHRAYHRLSLSSAAFILFIVDLPLLECKLQAVEHSVFLPPPSAVSVELRIVLSKRRASVNVYRGNEFLEHHSRR